MTASVSPKNAEPLEDNVPQRRGHLLDGVFVKLPCVGEAFLERRSWKVWTSWRNYFRAYPLCGGLELWAGRYTMTVGMEGPLFHLVRAGRSYLLLPWCLIAMPLVLAAMVVACLLRPVTVPLSKALRRAVERPEAASL